VQSFATSLFVNARGVERAQGTLQVP
jgi:hypothetical protein